MEQVVGIQFNGRGNVYQFSSGGIELSLHDKVIAETEQGISLGVVVSLEYPDGTREADLPDAPANAEAPFGSALPPLSDDVPAAGSSPEEGGPSESPVSADNMGEHSASGPDEADDSPAPEAFVQADESSRDEASREETPAVVPAPPAPAAPVVIQLPRPAPAKKQELLPILRRATEEDLVKDEGNATLAREAVAYCRDCIRQRNLDMKLVDVEVFFDRSKMVFFFTAPSRIDFRDLVKDLVHSYRTRIELRQIGVRHETQMIGALGNCGMVCCCRRYLRKFAPVTIKMAKEQNLFLNPAKISGICGRLLCCLSYEQENYETFHRSCPRLGKRYQTSRGLVKVLRSNMFRNSLIVLTENNEEQEITLTEWEELAPRRPDPQQLPPQQPQQAQEAGKQRPERREHGRKGPADRRNDRPERDRPERNDRNERPERDARPGQPDQNDAPRQEQSPSAEEAAQEHRHPGAAPREGAAVQDDTALREGQSSPPDSRLVEDAAPPRHMYGAAEQDFEDADDFSVAEDADEVGIFGLRRPAPHGQRQGNAAPHSAPHAPQHAADGQRPNNRRKRRPGRHGSGQSSGHGSNQGSGQGPNTENSD